MEVEVLRATEMPERLVCQAARGDYFGGYVGDTPYSKLMAGVDYDEDNIDVSKVKEDWKYHMGKAPNMHEAAEKEAVRRAKTQAFIKKQLSRGHYGPWEHPQITFAVKGVSRVTMAQITRHRHMTFDVQSQRYVDFSDTEAIVPKSLKDPDHFSRETGITNLTKDELEELRERYKWQVSESIKDYEFLVSKGVPKEDARFILPLGTPVNMTFSGNARTFMHIFNLRQKASSQWEIRELSDMLAKELKEWMPHTFSWYEQNKPHKIGP